MGSSFYTLLPALPPPPPPILGKIVNAIRRMAQKTLRKHKKNSNYTGWLVDPCSNRGRFVFQEGGAKHFFLSNESSLTKNRRKKKCQFLFRVTILFFYTQVMALLFVHRLTISVLLRIGFRVRYGDSQEVKSLGNHNGSVRVKLRSSGGRMCFWQEKNSCYVILLPCRR